MRIVHHLPHRILLKSLLGEPLMHCAGDLTVHNANHNNEIDCKFNVAPEIGKCGNKKKCLLSNAGEVVIKNCIPDKNSTILDMLMSFRRPNESKPLISPEDVSHLIFRVMKDERKGNII